MREWLNNISQDKSTLDRFFLHIDDLTLYIFSLKRLHRKSGWSYILIVSRQWLYFPREMKAKQVDTNGYRSECLSWAIVLHDNALRIFKDFLFFSFRKTLVTFFFYERISFSQETKRFGLIWVIAVLEFVWYFVWFVVCVTSFRIFPRLTFFRTLWLFSSRK